VDGVAQKPLDGVSIASTFKSAKARPVRSVSISRFSVAGRSNDKGWIACAQQALPWGQDVAPGHWEKDKCELYNLDDNFSEAADLAARIRKKLAELKRLFEQEAKRNNVYPLDARDRDKGISATRMMPQWTAALRT
jgi:arylsulfatase A-like enzyme